jgi:hypothetical protein
MLPICSKLSNRLPLTAGNSDLPADALCFDGNRRLMIARRISHPLLMVTSIAVITDHGFSLVPTGASPPADTTAPTINIPASITARATSPAGAVVFFLVTATDGGDPHPRVICTPASGSLIPIGRTVVTCTAIDASGNAASATFTILVIGPRELLRQVLNDVLAGKLGPGRSLAAKLHAAVAALESGKPTSEVCGLLRGLINEVQAQSGKHLTRQQSITLAMQIAAARTLLGCAP